MDTEQKPDEHFRHLILTKFAADGLTSTMVPQIPENRMK
jgi:hypothetical protein